MPVQSDRHEAAKTHYDDKLGQAHLGSSREVKTEEVAVTVLGLSNGRIATMYSTIFSAEDVEVVWRVDRTIQLSDWRFAWDRCLHDATMQKAARQFKDLTLERYAKMINGTTVDIVAAFQRMGEGRVESSVSGDACYLFQRDCKLAKDCIRASAMRRDELEGVALLATPHGDYSLRTSERVMYSLGEGGIWHIDADGETGQLNDSDLVGAECW